MLPNGTYNFYPNKKTSSTNLQVVSSSMEESSLSTNILREEKMRVNFRDFFIYAIKGSQSDPIQAGVCSSSCLDEINCCAKIFGSQINSNFTANDNLCMRKSVVNAWSDLTIDKVSYTMKCAD